MAFASEEEVKLSNVRGLAEDQVDCPCTIRNRTSDALPLARDKQSPRIWPTSVVCMGHARRVGPMRRHSIGSQTGSPGGRQRDAVSRWIFILSFGFFLHGVPRQAVSLFLHPSARYEQGSRITLMDFL